MKILIIGGTGNISTAITKLMLERGNDVTLYNRGKTQVEGTKCISGDRKDYRAFESQMAQIGEFDCVIDMIAFKPEDALTDVRAFRGRIGQLIFCSTVDVYTKPAVSYPVQDGDERKPSPSFPYAYDKAACENIFEEAAARGDFPLTIIRPAATYNDSATPISLLGPGTTLMKRIRRGSPVIILGDGTSFWVSSHRDDVAEAFANAVGNEKTFGRSYNVTGDEIMTWKKYYQTAAKVMNAPDIDFVHIPTDLLGRIAPKSAEWCVTNFKYNNFFDNSAAKAELGYRYNINWEEGVRRMVTYHDSRGDIDNSPEYPYYDMIVQRFRDAGDGLAAELSPFDP